MKILAIETSCDETAAAVVENGTTILSNVIASSRDLHEKTGGIIPEIAAREQMKCMVPVLEEAMKQAAGSKQQEVRNKKELFASIDALAVTVGPGLIGSLLIGVETAKTLAMVTGKPLIPVNHIFAHIYGNFLTSMQSAVSGKQKCTDNNQPHTANRMLPTFPTIALVVSGGHTELFLMKGHGDLKWLGGTMDDAAGEAFDKTARMIGLGYGGGAAIAAETEKFRSSCHPERSEACLRRQGPRQIYESQRDSSSLRLLRMTRLPRPMLQDDSLNFSFSGLKTAVAREIKELEERGHWNEETRQHCAHEIQEAITDVLVAKTIKAAQQYSVASILLGGGVAANQGLKEKMESKIKNLELGISFFVPEPRLCTDNAVVIASCAYFNQHPVSWQDIQADPGLSVEVM